MIHILFSSSAAGTLRQVLRERGRSEKVVDLTDNLSWGPIGSDNLQDRETWLDHHVPGNRTDAWDWIADSSYEFLECIASDEDRLIWLAPRSSQEQCGLHWYLASSGGGNTQMIVADYALGDKFWPELPPPNLGVLARDAIAELLDRAPRSRWRPSDFPPEKWRELMEDNDLLRIVDDGSLRSVPGNYFDRFIVRRCPADWTAPIRVIGYSMSDIWDAGHDVDDAFLLWRIRMLVQSGEFICNGELPRRGGISGNVSKVRLSAQE
ncbi:MAG: DUF1835 domain-containing protein [Sphingomonas bacterium]|nr:DUF1835 domain-containing protein [Sphingomonas bacterium]